MSVGAVAAVHPVPQVQLNKHMRECSQICNSWLRGRSFSIRAHTPDGSISLAVRPRLGIGCMGLGMPSFALCLQVLTVWRVVFAVAASEL